MSKCVRKVFEAIQNSYQEEGIRYKEHEISNLALCGLISTIRNIKNEEAVLFETMYLVEAIGAKLAFDSNFFRLSQERLLKLIALNKSYLVESESLVELKNIIIDYEIFWYD
jgi:ATP-dependent RNA circularization protein (DNA/RNA ligase family)